MTITRIQVPMSAETREAYQALADVQRNSLASVAAEILEQAAPIVREMAEALQTAKQAPARALRQMTEVMDRELAKADQMKLDMEPKPGRKHRPKKAG